MARHESLNKKYKQLEASNEELKAALEQLKAELEKEKNNNRKKEKNKEPLEGLENFLAYLTENDEEKRKLLGDEPKDSFSNDHDVILLALSILGRQLREETWTYGQGTSLETYEGCIGQMEDVLRHFIKHSQRNIDIIVLCTDNTLTKTEQYDVYGTKLNEEPAVPVFSTYDFLKYRIRVAPESEEKTIRFQPVRLDEEDVFSSIQKVISKIRKSIPNNKTGKNKLFIDTHGSFREVSLLLNAIVFLLGKTDKESRIIPEQICGVKTSSNTIVDQTDTYRIFDFVTGISDFVNYGNADVLNHYFENEEEDTTTRMIVDEMNAVSLAIQMCDPQQYTQNLQSLKQLFDELRNPELELEHNPLLDIFAEQIEADFGERLLSAPEEERDFWIIRRCLDKKMYQQALTIIDAKLPRYYYNHGIFYYDIPDGQELPGRNSSSWKDDDSYVFETVLNRKCRYFPHQNGNDGDNMILAMNTIAGGYKNYKDRIHHLFPENEKIPFRNNVSITIKSDLSTNMKKQAAFALRIHKALKDYRNTVNHASSNDERVSPDVLEKVIREYLRLLNNLKTSVDNNNQ